MWSLQNIQWCLGKNINTGSNIGANKLCAYFFKSQSEYKDFAVNCKISQSCLACHCCTFSLPHDIFLTKSIIYMGFKFNLNVMNLNWALLYFKVVGLLFCKLTFSTRDSTSGFWFQLLSLTLKPPPRFFFPSLPPSQIKSSRTAFNWLVVQEGCLGRKKGAIQLQAAHVRSVRITDWSQWQKSVRRKSDTFWGGTAWFSLHISAYLSNHSLPQSGALLILHPIALLHQISNTSETNQIKN